MYSLEDLAYELSVELGNIIKILGKVYGETMYFVDATGGNDSNDGLTIDTAWKTIVKVNAATFNPGEKVLFKRGEDFSGTTEMNVSDSGEAGNPIIFDAYGSGEAPILNNTSDVAGLKDTLTLDGDYITVRNLYFGGHSDGIGIVVNGEHSLIDSVEITGYWRGISVPGKYTEVTNCSIHDMVLDNPASSYGAEGVTILTTDCEISYTYFLNCIDDNDSAGKDGSGIEFYGTTNNAYVHHNLFEACNIAFETGSGDGNGTSNDVLFSYNIILNSYSASAGFHLAGEEMVTISNWRFYNNTVIYTGTKTYEEIYFSGGDPNYEFKLQNCIFYNTAMDYISDLGANNITHLNNRIYIPGGTAGWALDETESYGDPVFVTKLSDFHLQSGSPCRNAGTDVGLTEDYDGVGVPQETNPAIGAYEFERVSVKTPSRFARTCGVCEAWNQPFLCDLLISSGRANCLFGNIV